MDIYEMLIIIAPFSATYRSNMLPVHAEFKTLIPHMITIIT